MGFSDPFSSVFQPAHGCLRTQKQVKNVLTVITIFNECYSLFFLPPLQPVGHSPSPPRTSHSNPHPHFHILVKLPHSHIFTNHEYESPEPNVLNT